MICYLSQKNIGNKKGFSTTDSCEPARTHVQVITLARFNLLSLSLSEHGSHPKMWGQTLSRSYGRCIAEFLSEGSLVSLSLLDSSTCVGLRYGRLSPRVHLLF